MSFSHWALVVYLMSLNPVPPVPFPLPPPHPSRYLFWCFAVLLLCLFLCFLGFLGFFFFFFFFFFFLQFMPIFSAPVSLPSVHCWLFSRPHRYELPPCSSLYGVSVHAIGFFPCISFCLYSVLLLFFSLYFVCYLLVIMLWPRWFD
jgi:hypothetical protein